MVRKTKYNFLVGLILAGLACAFIPSFILYRQRIPEQPMYQFLHGNPIEMQRSLDKLLEQGKLGIEDLNEFALDEELHIFNRIAAVRKLGEYGESSFPVLVEVLASTDFIDGHSRELASAATYELSRNDGITDDVIPLVFKAYTALPPWDESFRPAGLLDSDIRGPGGWYGCTIDTLIDESWFALYELGDRAVPFLTETSNGDDQETAKAASALINEIQTGKPDQYHQAYSYWAEMVWMEDN